LSDRNDGQDRLETDQGVLSVRRSALPTPLTRERMTVISGYECHVPRASSARTARSGRIASPAARSLAVDHARASATQTAYGSRDKQPRDRNSKTHRILSSGADDGEARLIGATSRR
jgi:hypothetical protein